MNRMEVRAVFRSHNPVLARSSSPEVRGRRLTPKGIKNKLGTKQPDCTGPPPLAGREGGDGDDISALIDTLANRKGCAGMLGPPHRAACARDLRHLDGSVAAA